MRAVRKRRRCMGAVKYTVINGLYSLSAMHMTVESMLYVVVECMCMRMP